MFEKTQQFAFDIFMFRINRLFRVKAATSWAESRLLGHVPLINVSAPLRSRRSAAS